MPWRRVEGGYARKGRKQGGFVRNPAQYEKLRGKGMSKEQAARITNASGHEAFAKAAPRKQQKPEGTGAIIGGGALMADAAASAPVLRVGRKSPTSVIGSSPKRQARRYQGELTRAMQTGKVGEDSPLRVFKTPSGRYVNAGGTHRHIARQEMGKPSRVEVKSLAYEPRFSLKAKLVNQHKINQLRRGSRDAIKGVNKPVGTKARGMNEHLAHAADVGDDAIWRNASKVTSKPGAVKAAERVAHGNALFGGALGAGILGVGLLARHETKQPKQKVVKTMDGHEAFEISKRNRDTSLGRDVTGALFPGIHGAIAGKPGHKLKAAAYEVGGGLIVPTVGAGVGTHIASQQGHYVKLKRKKRVAKAATGHEAFELSEIEKALAIPGAAGMAKAGSMARGAVKGVAGGAGVLKPLVMKEGGGLTRGAKIAGTAGGVGFGGGYMAGRRH